MFPQRYEHSDRNPALPDLIWFSVLRGHITMPIIASLNTKSNKMKKYILIVTIFCFASIFLFAQHDHSSHQKQNPASTSEVTNKPASYDAGSQKQLSQLLAYYYNIKNALVAGDAASASVNALTFTKTVNSIDYKVISEGNIHTLANDAGKIAETRDIKKQREYFANFSVNMAAVAKAVKLTDQPIYQAYCPMKKAYWLSNEKAIKNPYYGSSMLTCGEVKETL